MQSRIYDNWQEDPEEGISQLMQFIWISMENFMIPNGYS